MAFSCALDRRGGLLCLVLTGEIDMAVADRIAEATSEALRTWPATAVEIDLHGVTFIDSSGVGALMAARTTATQHGCTFRVTNAHGIVRRVFEVIGVFEALTGCQGRRS